MTAKEKIIQTVETLPADTTFEELQETVLKFLKYENRTYPDTHDYV